MERFEKIFFEKRYPILTRLLRNNKFLLTCFKIIYYGLPVLMAVTYIAYVIHRFRAYGKQTLIKTVGVPAAAFISLSVFRRVFSSRRPYEKFDYEPVLGSTKKGRSMPSRHTFSAGVITAVISSDYPMLAPFLWVGTVVIALSRLFAGVHHIRDIAVSFLVSVFLSVMLKLRSGR